MNWELRQLTFRAESPIHIGWHRLGLIARTRYYIPARNLWGSWIASFARLHRPGGAVPAIYTKAEQELSNAIRFTPLFVGKDPLQALRPKFAADGLSYGGLSPQKFEATYVRGIASAAIDAATFTAETGALHEKEYLAASAPAEPLFLTGYLLSTPGFWTRIEPVLKAFSIGADQTYGYGRCSLESSQLAGTRDIFNEFTLLDGFHLQARNAAFLPAFTPFHPNHASSFAGELEVIAGRRQIHSPADGPVPKGIPHWPVGASVAEGTRLLWHFDGVWTVIPSHSPIS